MRSRRTRPVPSSGRRARGGGAEVVSRGELELALAAGVPPGRIMTTAVAKADHEIDAAIAADIRAIQMESVEEILRVAARARARRSRRAPVLSREPGREHRLACTRCDGPRRREVRDRALPSSERVGACGPRPVAARRRCGRACGLDAQAIETRISRRRRSSAASRGPGSRAARRSISSTSGAGSGSTTAKALCQAAGVPDAARRLLVERRTRRAPPGRRTWPLDGGGAWRARRERRAGEADAQADAGRSSTPP